MDHANTAVNWALFIVCLLAAAVACARLFRPEPGRFGRGGELVHVVMLVAMAGMWTTAGAELPIAFWRIVFGAVAVGSSVWLIVGGRRFGPARKGGRSGASELFGEESGAAIYHGIAALAMVYATLTPAGPHPGHTAHASSPPIPAIGWVLVALFVLDAMVLAATALRVPERFGRSRPATFAAVFPHATMDFAMATMLTLALRPPG